MWQVFCHHGSISEERFGDEHQVCASHESHRQGESWLGDFLWHDEHIASSLPKTYNIQNQKLFVAWGEEREASFAYAAAELRKDVPEDQVLDITMTCDGTWVRLGFQSLYDIVVVVSWKTGKVLDVEGLSKHCQGSATHRGMDTFSDEFLDFWEGH